MLKSSNPRRPRQICHYSGVMRLSSIGGPLLYPPGAVRAFFGSGLAG
jgi:hypothetical protein